MWNFFLFQRIVHAVIDWPGWLDSEIWLLFNLSLTWSSSVLSVHVCEQPVVIDLWNRCEKTEKNLFSTKIYISRSGLAPIPFFFTSSVKGNCHCEEVAKEESIPFIYCQDRSSSTCIHYTTSSSSCLTIQCVKIYFSLFSFSSSFFSGLEVGRKNRQSVSLLFSQNFETKLNKFLILCSSCSSSSKLSSPTSDDDAQLKAQIPARLRRTR